jgi:hypothetical protein
VAQQQAAPKKVSIQIFYYQAETFGNAGGVKACLD